MFCGTAGSSSSIGWNWCPSWSGRECRWGRLYVAALSGAGSVVNRWKNASMCPTPSYPWWFIDGPHWSGHLHNTVQSDGGNRYRTHHSDAAHAANDDGGAMIKQPTDSRQRRHNGNKKRQTNKKTREKSENYYLHIINNEIQTWRRKHGKMQRRPQAPPQTGKKRPMKTQFTDQLNKSINRTDIKLIYSVWVWMRLLLRRLIRIWALLLKAALVRFVSALDRNAAQLTDNLCSQFIIN